MKKKPQPKDFGFELECPSMGEEGGWMFEGGEERYEMALRSWQLENQCPKCMRDVGEEELGVFGGLCENCNEKYILIF